MQSFRDSLFEVSGVADPNMILNVTVPEAVQKQVEEWHRGTRKAHYSKTPSPPDLNSGYFDSGYHPDEEEEEDAPGQGNAAGQSESRERLSVDLDSAQDADTDGADDDDGDDDDDDDRHTGGATYPDEMAPPPVNDEAISCDLYNNDSSIVICSQHQLLSHHRHQQLYLKSPTTPPGLQHERTISSNEDDESGDWEPETFQHAPHVEALARKRTRRNASSAENGNRRKDSMPTFFQETLLFAKKVKEKAEMGIQPKTELDVPAASWKRPRHAAHCATRSQRHVTCKREEGRHRMTNSGDLETRLLKPPRRDESRHSSHMTSRGGARYRLPTSHTPSPPRTSARALTAPLTVCDDWLQSTYDAQLEAEEAVNCLQRQVAEMDDAAWSAASPSSPPPPPPPPPDRRSRLQSTCPHSVTRPNSGDLDPVLACSLPAIPAPCFSKEERDVISGYMENESDGPSVDDITSLSVEETVDFFLNMTSPMSGSDSEGCCDWPHFKGILHVRRAAHARFSVRPT